MDDNGVYIVYYIWGEYINDYRKELERVFATRQSAEDYIKIQNCVASAYVIEFEEIYS